MNGKKTKTIMAMVNGPVPKDTKALEKRVREVIESDNNLPLCDRGPFTIVNVDRDDDDEDEVEYL